MANKIQVKRGVEANLPTLDVGEPAFTTDSKKPFIGSDSGNVELATKAQINTLAEQLEDGTAGIDDNVISDKKVWSSKKTQEQVQLIPKGERGISGAVAQDNEPIDDEIVVWVDTSTDDGDILDYATSNVEITFIGDKTKSQNGDASLIKFPNGETLGIDFGIESYGATLKSTYQAKNVTKLDYIIISHWHDDHVGGLKYLLDNNYIDIEGATVFLPNANAVQYAIDNGILGGADSAYINPIMTHLANKNCKLIYPSSEFETHKIGDAELVFFNVNHTIYNGTTNNYNDKSLCVYIFYGNMNTCFAGDIGQYAKNQLKGKLYKANIYKAPHHGWDNSTIPPEYFNNVCPDVVFSIDGTVHNSYIDQASSRLQTWCEKNGVSNYRVAVNGTMTVNMSKDSWRLMTPASRYIRNKKNWKFTDNSEFIE